MLGKFTLLAILVVFTFGILVSSQNAFATDFTISDQSSCEDPSIGGTLDVGTSTCTITGLTLNSGKGLIIATGVTLRNTGTIDNTGIIYNSGTIDNTGTITNAGTINNNAGGTINVGIELMDGTTVSGTLINNLGGIIDNAGVIVLRFSAITNNAGSTINNSGTIEVGFNTSGDITNIGTLNNNSDGIINIDQLIQNNLGTINNFGTINSGVENNFGTLNNSAGGTIVTISNFHSSTTNNSGTISGDINNDVGSTINNSGTINGSFSNSKDSVINNNASGIINLYTASENVGTINNFGTINNYGSLYNSGTINNFCGASYLGNPPIGNPINNIPCDSDGDGIYDQVDTQPNTFSNDFSDGSLGGSTSGTIVTRGDQTLTITEEPKPNGVRISAALSGGIAPAIVSVCGSTKFLFSAGDEAIVTCGSVIVEVITGQVEAVLDANTGSTTTATLSAGGGLTFEPLTFTLQSNSGTPSIMLVAPDGTVATFDLPTGNSVIVDPTTSALTSAETNPDTIVVFIGAEQHSLSSGSTVFVDTTPPSITFSGSINDGNSFYFGDVPASPTCNAFDDISGVSGTCAVTGFSTAVGTHTLTATATDNAGNVGTSTITYHVLAWTISGFYQPVDMGNVLNTVNNGRTVPMKFEVFKGTTELTDTAIATVSLNQVTCGTGMFIDDVEITTTGNTSLRYDTSSGQFIYNWKTPQTANACYDVVLTTSDTSTITAHFKLK